MDKIEEKITFSKLSFWVKCGIVGGLINLFIYCVAFMVGFINGLLQW